MSFGRWEWQASGRTKRGSSVMASADAHDCSQVGMSQLHALRHSTQYLKQHHHKAEKKRLCCQMILAKAPSGELRLPCATELLIVKHTVLSLCKVMDMVGDGN